MPQEQPIRIAVCADPPHEVRLQQQADAIAKWQQIAKTKIANPNCDLLLAVTTQRLELRVLTGESDLTGGNPVFAELETIDTTSPAGRKLDMPLLRSVGIKKGQPHRPTVIDATCGFGEDAWLLASHGCKVYGYERHAAIASLLLDAIQRAAKRQPNIAERISVMHLDAKEILLPPRGEGKHDIDAIVLDPMFPLGRKAKERKPMRVLRLLAGDDDDAPTLLQAALDTGVHRVCVKRPLKAAVIHNEKRPAPDVVYKGKAVRFDVYFNH